GYIDYFTVRGFVIDNRFNYRRDGLPINAETSIPLENKARVDVLKGLSGMQAGTSAPGGLVDLIVKRPLDAPLRSAFVEWRERGSVLGAVDLSQRFGVGDAFGLRVNAAAERIDPELRDARGQRNVLAAAGDWRLGTSTLVEAEVETSHRSQPSVPGFSLLGDRVPAVPDPRLSLNNQAWSLPVVFDATTASLRVTHKLGADWRVVAHAMTQRLRTDDRIAFPFGCSDPNPPPDGTYYPSSYCPDGSFDLYDFRSDDERRRNNAFDLSLHGRFATGAVSHDATAGALRTNTHLRFGPQVFNFAGTGNVDGTAQVPPAPLPTAPATNRDERSTELYLRDAVAFGERATLWLGLRHTRLERDSASNDPVNAPASTRYGQSFTTPFLAASYAFRPGQTVYASWGRGVESDVAPDLPRYANAGQPLPAATSRQIEVGLKGGGTDSEWGLAAFDIDRPLFGDLGACDVDASCTRGLDGRQRHRGVEASAALRRGRWDLRAGVQWLHARVEGTQDAALDGKRATNVPAFTLRLQAGYAVAALPGLTLQGAAAYESARAVVPDNSVGIPGWTRFDLGARYAVKHAGTTWTLRAGIDNLLDKRAWRESPYQFDHAYLFPLAPRTFRLSLQADL
ncbi:MAG: TonB-dependent siderophore receptor, partial [Caldimonas sp.]